MEELEVQPIGFAILGFLMITVFLFATGCAMVKSNNSAPTANEIDFYVPPEGPAGPAPVIPSVKAVRAASIAIPQTLELVQAIDVNGDGLVNCIDYTIQFWMFYPNKNEVRIIWNKHPTNGWNHLFAEVGIYTVECGAFTWTTNQDHKHWKIDWFWPRAYNPTYDVNVTDKMPLIIAGRYFR